MPEWIKDFVVGWPLVKANLPTFFILIVIITVGVWGVLNWAYGSILRKKDAEIKLLERKVEQASNLPAPVKLVENAELSLHIYGDHRTPDRLSFSNIWRWYFLQDIMQFVNMDGSKHSEHLTAKLFINFDNPVLVGTLNVRADKLLPIYEVKEFNNRFAIIVFAGPVPECNLTITITL